MADYAGRDQRLSYLFQNGGGGGSACLYDAEKVNSIYTNAINTNSNVSSLVAGMAPANAGIAEILRILGGGGGGGTIFRQLVITEIVSSSTEFTITTEVNP